MSTKRITFHADEPALAYLARKQKETGASVSETIRRALRKMDELAPIEKRQQRPLQPVLLSPHAEAE